MVLRVDSIMSKKQVDSNVRSDTDDINFLSILRRGRMSLYETGILHFSLQREISYSVLRLYCTNR